MGELIRKCKICKVQMPLDESIKGKAIRYENSWYHLDCFINICESRIKRKGHDPKWDVALSEIPQLIKMTNDFLDDYVVKDKIYRHILSAYNLSMCPAYIFTKLDGIYEGTLKGIAQPIPPSHLLDMWIQKQKWLDKHAEQKKSKGDNMTGVSRVVYDLAILCGKYGDYKKWLETEKIKDIAEANEYNIQKSNIDYSKIKVQNSKPKIGLGDINDLLNDII